MKFIMYYKNSGGKGRNIYFPFDISSDTALDVAREMVKELEINDWNPVEIAEMIDDEISALVPSWKHWGSHFYHQHNRFHYDDDINHPTFYSISSHSSSHSSLPDLLSTSWEAPFPSINNAIISGGYDCFPAGISFGFIPSFISF